MVSFTDNHSLQWPKWKKLTILAICSLYSFLSNTALLGPSVYIVTFATDMGITPTVASQLISYPNLVYGCGTLVTVPMYLKFGRRPVMLGSMLVYLVGLIGCSRSSTYGGLMACRIIHTFASGVCEALPVQLVNDIFFCTCTLDSASILAYTDREQYTSEVQSWGFTPSASAGAQQGHCMQAICCLTAIPGVCTSTSKRRLLDCSS